MYICSLWVHDASFRSNHLNIILTVSPLDANLLKKVSPVSSKRVMSPNEKNFIFIANQGCIDFVNTEFIDQGRKVDLLGSFSDVLSWMVVAKMLTPAQASRATNEWSGARRLTAFDEARGFRGMMREMVDQIARGKAVPRTALSEINQRLRAGSAFPQVFKKGRGFQRRLERDFAEPAHLLARLAESAADLVCNYDFSSVKRCKNPACVLYFYDTTKNHRRNWCSMGICGNRMKVAAFYLRSRTLKLRLEKRTQNSK
jgi:predicted RNA-binding Zn ribbon-like protein